MPLEYYPPITNLLQILGQQAVKLGVWSTQNIKHRDNYVNNNLAFIKRNSFPKVKEPVIVRLLKYMSFNWQCFFGLIRFKPDMVVYYESYSAFPICLYYLTFGRNKSYFIHYHEYESPEAYNNGMRLVKYYHILEKRYLYPVAQWISQTNQDRLQLFRNDHPSVKSYQLHVMPNYPPANWWSRHKTTQYQVDSIIKTVYVGSLSLKDTFIEEYCNWVLAQNGKVHFDVFAYNLHKDTIVYLNDLKSPYINFYSKGIAYDSLPDVLVNYDIGLILYKAHTENYQYNAPNKLFEYLACGLGVLYPDVMLGIKPYESHSIKSVNFAKLQDIDVLFKVYQANKNQNLTYTAECAYEDFITYLLK
jgi:hypothetical protein